VNGKEKHQVLAVKDVNALLIHAVSVDVAHDKRIQAVDAVGDNDPLVPALRPSL
jgi:hypothetical protein